MQAVSAVLQGKYTMSGEQFETVEVDFGRSAANNITQAGGREWSKQNADTFDPTHDLDAYCDFASGTINIAIMDGTVWRMLNGFKLFREKLDTRRGSKSELETALKDLGSVVSLKVITVIWPSWWRKQRMLMKTGMSSVICRKAH